jgi:hypothetical protein
MKKIRTRENESSFWNFIILVNDFQSYVRKIRIIFNLFKVSFHYSNCLKLNFFSRDKLIYQFNDTKYVMWIETTL